MSEISFNILDSCVLLSFLSLLLGFWCIFIFSGNMFVPPHTRYEQACFKLTCGLHWVTVFPWPVRTAEAAVFRVRHLWGRPHPGNAQRFITYWYTPSLNTPQKTPTVHSWLMSCSASNPWIIFLKRIFLPFSTLHFCDFTSSVKKIKYSVCSQIKKQCFSLPSCVSLAGREREWKDGGWSNATACTLALSSRVLSSSQ